MQEHEKVNDALVAISEIMHGDVSVNVDLSQLSRWRIGGVAAAVVEPETTKQVVGLCTILESLQVPYLVIGETTNLLFDTAGFAGIIIKVSSRMSKIEIAGENVTVAAGTKVEELTTRLAEEGLSGLEHIAGIPGTVGGLVVMNGGSQRKGIGDSVAWIESVDKSGGVKTRKRDELDFSYRSSHFGPNVAAIISIGLLLRQSTPIQVLSEVEQILTSRDRRFPSNRFNCGSTFLSDPAMYDKVGPPGRAIEDAGLKGRRVGGAMVSSQHANFIDNVGGATSDDVLRLIAEIQATVDQATGFLMESEVRYVSPEGVIEPASRYAVRKFPDIVRFGG